MLEASIFKKNKPYLGGPISISGPSAVGKSTIGEMLAENLKVPFYDLDDEVSNAAGMQNTKEVIRKLGHKNFKKVQNARLREICEKTSGTYILAAGGEIIRLGYDKNIIKNNRKLLNRYTYNICLLPSNDINETVEILYPRLNDGKRDTRTKNREELKNYTEVALSQYMSLSDMAILTHKSSIDAVLALIMSQIKSTD